MSEISDSEFFKWRTVFAMAHADGIMAQEERKFMTEILLKYDFSEEQKKALLLDIQVPQDPFQMFDYMTTIKDRDDFYGLAEESSPQMVFMRTKRRA